MIRSLGNVDDAATSALMQKFYELWRGSEKRPGLSTAEALHQAQAFIRTQKRWQYPYYWGAWVLWGLPD